MSSGIPLTSQEFITTKEPISVEPREVSLLDWKPTILVMSGGGGKGIFLPGALYALQVARMLDKIRIYAASSVGAMFAAFMNVGYTPHELMNVAYHTDFSVFDNNDFKNFYKTGSLKESAALAKWIGEMIKAKTGNANITLFELYDTTRIMFITCAVELNYGIRYISYQSFPDLPLVTALMMAMAYPLAYPPVQYDGKYYVDGGLINNYMIHMFQGQDKVLGIRLGKRDVNNPSAPKNFDVFIPQSQMLEMKSIKKRFLATVDLIKTMFHTVANHNEAPQDCDSVYEIQIDTSGVDTMSLNVPQDKRLEMIHRAISHVNAFLCNFKKTTIYPKEKLVIQSMYLPKS